MRLVFARELCGIACALTRPRLWNRSIGSALCHSFKAVSYFYNRHVPVYISRPPTSGGVRNVINFGDCVPEEILRGAGKARLLSDMKKAAIHKRWVQLTAHQSNLRIWNSGDVENVCDEYYDADIQSAMVESIPLAE